MAHSPLFRTIMRGHWDARAASLTKYELALEELSADKHGLRHAAPLLDDDAAEGWHAYRKSRELKAARDARLAQRERDLWAGASRDDGRLGRPLARPLRYAALGYPRRLDARQKAELPLARSIRHLKMVKMLRAECCETDITTSTTTTATSKKSKKDAAVVRSYAEWRPPLRAEMLKAEAVGASLCPPALRWRRLRGTPARASARDPTVAGVLDAWVLRSALTPDYVPKPHLRRERARLLARSAEFAALVARRGRREGWKLPEAEGGDSDDSADDDSDRGPRSTGKKRKGPPTAVAQSYDAQAQAPASKKQRTSAGGKAVEVRRQPAPAPTPKPFKKDFDCRAHDEMQLRAQARSRFCLAQQKLPRVEQPLWGAGMSDADEEEEEGGERAGAGEADEEPGSDEVAEKPKSKKSKGKKETVSPHASTEEEALQMLKAVGIKLPTLIPDKYNWDTCEDVRPDVEMEENASIGEIGFDEASRYCKWRKTPATRAFFEECSHYVRYRMYKEQTREKEITLTVRRLLQFWKNRV